MKEPKQHEAKYWMGDKPKDCDICHKALGDSFVDGATTMGPWGIMCKNCFPVFGVGLGIGRGQRYEKQSDDRWLKVW
jgi:hypothetical protein